jgi:hypothetical protein
MSDVVVLQMPDGGEINCANGVIELGDGPETAAFLSLFGGNEDDSAGDDGKSSQWWGNVIESDPAKRMRSETQHLLRSIAITSGNIARIEDAISHDLAWMVETEFASFVGGAVSIPALNTIRIDVKIVVQDVVYTPAFIYKRSIAS